MIEPPPTAPSSSRVAGGLSVRVLDRIGDVAADQWDACAHPTPATTNPFVSHAFLMALEDAGSVGPRTGWIPQHVVVENAAGRVVAAAPCYLKGHSQGEYVFDFAWADAYQRAGGRYYPKLLVAVPFTPVPGPRLLVPPGAEHDRYEAVLATALIDLARQMNLSSLHLTFVDADTATRLGAQGFLERNGQQFHWANEGYESFDDFLATFASRKRKGVRKEREQAVAAGIEIEHITGAAITEAHWDAMYRFYVETGNRKWGQPYLNRRFFSLLGASMADRCLLIFAMRADQPIAGALNLIGGDCLYGRYWGAIEQHACLHFEICYYQSIDFAIKNKLARVEAGAQGEHKLARGYLPTTTYSAHWIANPAFKAAVERFLVEERAAVAEAVALYADAAPFRKADRVVDARAEDHD
jgi:uncharacterized protein